MGFVSVFKSLLNTLGGFFNWRASLADNEPIHEIIEDKNSCEKAVAYATEAFKIVNECAVFRNKFARTRFKYFEKKFNNNK